MITLTLWNARITATTGGPPIAATGMNCGLFLVGDNTATAAAVGSNAGVHVPSAASLAIYGPGSLTAQAKSRGAGIGGSAGQSSGNIEIRHTTVTATGGSNGGAGIGGIGSGYNITVTNAWVTATGGNGSDIIGGGAGIGGHGGPGSGGGRGGSVSLTDSLVLATGGNGGFSGSGGGGAGIGGGGGGGGAIYGGNGGDCDAVSLTDSLVLVTGGNGGFGGFGGSGGGGAGIGGGGGGGSATSYGGNGGSLAGTLSITAVQLDTSSSGGTGGTSTLLYAGGNGALCGGGGGGGGDTSAGYGGGGSTDANGAEFNSSLTPSGPSVTSMTRPNTSDPGYLAQIPAFTGQPSPATILAGGNASFTVAATGGLNTVPMAYQWQVSADGGVTWSDIGNGGVVSGAQTNTLTLTGVLQAMNGRWYRCVAMDAAFQDAYSNEVPLAVQALSNDKDITGFTIQGANGVINQVAGTINVTLPYGADVRSLAPAITLSPLATVSPASGVARDFTSPVDYTVTAQDGTTRTYRVTVAVQPPPPPRPPSNLPQTGDSFPVEGLVAALLVMGLALAGTGWLTFRRRIRR